MFLDEQLLLAQPFDKGRRRGLGQPQGHANLAIGVIVAAVAAQAELDAALTPAPGHDPDWLPGLRRAELHALRGQAYRRQARYEDAYSEVGLGVTLAAAAGREDVARRLRDEQLLIEKHAGRALSSFIGQ